MYGPRVRDDLAKPLRRLFILSAWAVAAAAVACGPALPTAVEDGADAVDLRGLVLALDTLDVEVHNVWVQISAVPTVPQDLALSWELVAATANPFWRPQVMRRTGSKRFVSPDTARVWGNVPRAYDFSLVVSGRTQAGEVVSDTLNVVAPVCRDSSRPTLVCNVGARERRSVERGHR